MKKVARFARGIAARSGFAVLAVTLLATAAAAHEGEQWPLGGDSLKMGWSSTGQKTKLQFKTKGQININAASVSEDPTVDGATLLVRGTGSSAGDTGIIPLGAGYWKRIGKAEAPTGWKFKGDGRYTDGVSKVQIKSGKSGGSLQIQAKGYYFPFAINGPQDSVSIVLTLGQHVFCAEFSEDRMADFKTNTEGEVEATFALAPTACPAICGNGVLESGEQCDDGNAVNSDTCSNECIGCDASAAEFTSTFDGIQSLIFDSPAYNCSNDACHGSAKSGGLDLRAGNSYASLVGVASEIQPSTQRVFAGDQDLSMLYLKLAEKTLGVDVVDAPGTAMPSGFSALTADHLEAIRLWIRGGAPETGVVTGTAEKLGSCLPPATPLQIPQPPVPDPTVGTQFAMPGYTLPSGREIEGCVATYYDVSQTVPADKIVDCPGAFPGTNETGPNAGKCFTYSGNELWQDAQSHHSIVHIYPGDYNWNDPGWGGWHCYGGDTPNATCDPSVANSCGTDGVCGSFFHPGVACLGNWGAPDFQSGTSPQFSGSQESTANLTFPDGVYSVLPLKGLIVWNSHAFNLTAEDTTMNGWINMTYTADRTWPAQGLFDSQWIFTQHVPPFEQREYCATHTFPVGTRLFQLTSHTHKRGIRWRYYDAPQTPCGSGSGGNTDPACVPSGNIFYESYDYTDPTTLNYSPPKSFLSSAVEDRTIKFCALYDNGFLDPAHVKRRSTSPIPTNSLPVGGPCAAADAYCLGGPNKGQACFGSDANCPESVCDACELKGGVTTEDEMFIAIGTYYVNP